VRVLSVGLIVVSLGLQGCIAPYKFAKGEQSAQLHSLAGAPNICVNETLYSAPRSKDRGKFLVPVDQRVTISDSIMVDSYPFTYICVAQTSLVPTANDEYVYDINAIGQRCLLEIVRKSEDAPYGVGPVPSLGRSTCSPR
jgi:hypothetical protein